MVVFTNLEEVEINKRIFTPIPRLKLTTEEHFIEDKLSKRQGKKLELLRKEALENKFEIIIK